MGDSLKIGLTAAVRPAGALAALEDAESVRSSLGLMTPTPAGLVDESQALGAVKLEGSSLAKLDAMVADFVVAVTQLETFDPKFRGRLADIQQFGDDEIKASAEAGPRVLARSVNAVKKGALSNSSTVGGNLAQLRRQVDALDPGHQGDLFGERKLLGLVSLGGKLQAYLARYQSGQGHIDAILTNLENGRKAMAAENDEIALEADGLLQAIEQLRKYVYLAGKLDSSLETRIARVAASEPERGRIVREQMLAHLREKPPELSAHLAVSVQGYLTLDVVRRNNVELIRGIGRATTGMVAALRTAVIVTQGLGEQRLVLDEISALNMAAPARGANGGQLAAGSTIDVARLQTAFDSVYSALDELDAYRTKAVDALSRTADAMTAQISKAQSYLDRARAREAAGRSEYRR